MFTTPSVRMPAPGRRVPPVWVTRAVAVVELGGGCVDPRLTRPADDHLWQQRDRALSP